MLNTLDVNDQNLNSNRMIISYTQPIIIPVTQSRKLTQPIQQLKQSKQPGIKKEDILNTSLPDNPGQPKTTDKIQQKLNKSLPINFQQPMTAQKLKSLVSNYAIDALKNKIDGSGGDTHYHCCNCCSNPQVSFNLCESIMPGGCCKQIGENICGNLCGQDCCKGCKQSCTNSDIFKTCFGSLFPCCCSSQPEKP